MSLSTTLIGLQHRLAAICRLCRQPRFDTPRLRATFVCFQQQQHCQHTAPIIPSGQANSSHLLLCLPYTQACNKTMEQFAEVVTIVLLTCISDRIRDQTVNAVQLIEVSKIFGQTESCCIPWRRFLRDPSAACDRTHGESADERVFKSEICSGFWNRSLTSQFRR